MQGDFREDANDAIDFNTHRETDSYFLVEKYERLSVVVKNKQHVQGSQRCRYMTALIGEGRGKAGFFHKWEVFPKPLPHF